MASSLPPRLLRALGRLNASYPWDHNAHYHRWIMRQLPRRVSSALDVGCGAGELARLLAVRSEMVHGVDSDADIVERARESTRAGAPVRYTIGDAVGELPGGPHQVITCVAVLHHLPFGEALTAFRQQLAPGGTLVVVGLARAASPVDHLLGLAAIPLNPVIGWLKNGGRRATSRPVAMTARTRPATMTFPEIRREARRILPGVRLRRRLFWRYTMVWQRS